MGKNFLGVAFAHPKVFLYPHGAPCPLHLIFGGGNGQKTPLDPLFAVDLTNLGGEKPPMSIEAVVHAEDAGCRGYDSVGTLLR